MERKNPKQLRLGPEIAALAEEVHRDYRSAFKTDVSFQAFGNIVMRTGLSEMAVAIKNKRTRLRKRRRING